MKLQLSLNQNKIHYISVLSALFFHIIIVLSIIIFNSGKEKSPKSKPLRLGVSISDYQPVAPMNTISSSNFQRKRKIKKKKRIYKRFTKKKIKYEKVKTPTNTDDIIDCEMFDDASCSPCLVDKKTCDKCCGKLDSISKNSIGNSGKENNTGSCKGPDCVKTKACTPNALLELKSSFCPRVRSAVFSKIGVITLNGISKNSYLSAQIAVQVSAVGKISLASILKSSGSKIFDSAVKRAVSQSKRVLPPANLTTCILSRGCVFSVTIGAKKVNKTKSVIKIKNNQPKKKNKTIIKPDPIIPGISKENK